VLYAISKASGQGGRIQGVCIEVTDKGVVEAASVGTPGMVDPRPNSYIGEFRDSFPNLDFETKTRKLVIGK
jgi:hypothetical protein